MKVLVVVGKATSRAGFESALESRLADNFNIASVVPLTEENEIKRFLAYVTNEEESESVVEQVDAMATFLGDIEYTVEVFDSLEEAFEHAGQEYGEEGYSAYSFPIPSEAIFRRNVLFGLISIGEVTVFKAKLDGKPCMALASWSIGTGPNDAVATPLAILVDDELAERIEMPVKSSYDK